MITAPLRSAQGRPLRRAQGRGLLRRWGRLALDLLFPPRCAACGVMGSFLCDGCLQAMPRALPPRCPVCWRPGPFAALSARGGRTSSFGSACAGCRERPPAFEALRTRFLMEGPARQAVHALKYSHFSALAEDMGRLMAEFAAAEGLQADMVVPVPLHGRRRRSRGYNQSALLAKAVAAEIGLPLDEGALVRHRDTPQQARAASAAERRRNVEGAFAPTSGRPAEGRRRLEGRRVLLIDDVTTTGATLDACARALREAGAASVSCLAFARED